MNGIPLLPRWLNNTLGHGSLSRICSQLTRNEIHFRIYCYRSFTCAAEYFAPQLFVQFGSKSAQVIPIGEQLINRLATSSAGVNTPTELASFLLNAKYTEKQIEELIDSVPQLAVCCADDAKQLFELLHSYGFSTEETVKIVTGLPQIIGISLVTVADWFESLLCCGFDNEQLKCIVTRCPQVLELPAHQVRKHLSCLKQLFSNQQSLLCIRKMPRLLFEPWEKLQFKFHYAHFVMGFHQNEIVKTKLLSYPVGHIRARHQLLERAGLFMKPDSKGRCKIENPPLKSIVDSSDHHFAEKVANLSVEDYRVFCQLLELEEKTH